MSDAGEMAEKKTQRGAGTAVGFGRANSFTGRALAESTQATDPTSARILAAKRLSLSSPTSR